MALVDILLLSNGPGELITWVRPVVGELRHQLPHARLSLVLVPCSHASGREATLARDRLGLDRVQEPQHFIRFLLTGRTAERWDWAPHGVVLFLGGDQFYAVWLGRRLGYRVVVYAEWETRWRRFVDAFGVRTAAIAQKSRRRWRTRMHVVGDLMADGLAPALLPASHQSAGADPLGSGDASPLPSGGLTLPPDWQPLDRPRSHWQVGFLPGSKPAKLSLGVPLVLAVADRLRQQCPSIRFAIPVAPTLTTAQLADYAAATNPDRAAVYGTTAQLQGHPEQPQLVTPLGTIIDLWTAFPAYSLLANCDLCLTTVGANTAELARLGVPMVVILPTNKLDAMRAWDGLPGLLANLPWVGTAIAKVVNWIAHRYLGLLAWPNIWAEEEIVPELRGHLTPEAIAAAVSALLGDDTRRQTIRDRLQEWQAQPGAARALTDLVRRQLAATEPISVRRSSKFRT